MSCIRVFRTGASTCTNATEPCCNTDDPLTSWADVYSLTNGSPAGGSSIGDVAAAGGGVDHLLTVDEHERAVLLEGGWTEVCAPAGGATAFCGWGGSTNAM